MADRIFTPFIPTLTHLALVKIAIPLHNEFGIGRMNEAFNRIELGNSTESEQDSEDPELIRYQRAVKYLLLIPPCLRKRVLEAVHGLEYGICQWRADYSKILQVEDAEFIFYWRCDGTIDRMKTAQQLVQNANIDISQRFNLACTYCLEESIKTLWAEMVASGEAVNFKIDHNSMARFWLRWMREGSRVPWTQAAQKYLNPYDGAMMPRFSCFLPLLRPEHREKFLPILQHAFYDDLRFCLYAITKEEEEKALETCARELLYLCLEWPLRGLFLETAWKVLKYVEVRYLSVLLYQIFETKRKWKNFDYFELLEDFWNMIATHQREKEEERPRIRKEIASCFDEMRKKRKAANEELTNFKKKKD
ncbi:hypothetical protein AVEN_141744-1 [Araneus ventricosus]|uniref:Uncharacterized protein n=1 Tax=Araneus ventricosus TaxID=182803 RepID=A0A4Y2V326_ARAVE|nr:hypothetical protein AVEN_148742-1 [Araneus ventricosus]GBO18937.1 hypothetical protein AVEN_124939-1 [Araneus ventricosus]GBO18958.1 hypothetical protein AVEN_261193-1 [Araneus ventricosus]GBO18963.1 hypothetical protein AVEN_141744-1 [Araneus ventricosus]